jgi:hypothetical protein
MIVFKLCQQVPWELKNQIKTTQNCLSSLKFSQISSGQNKNWSKKSSQDLICPPKNKKMHFLNKMTSEKSFWSQNQQLVEVDVLKKKKIKKTKSRIKKKDSFFLLIHCSSHLFWTVILSIGNKNKIELLSCQNYQMCS